MLFRKFEDSTSNLDKIFVPGTVSTDMAPPWILVLFENREFKTLKPAHLIQYTDEVPAREIPFYIVTFCRSIFAVSPRIALPENLSRILAYKISFDLS